ncbi:hypothetical protein ACN27E_05440 [Mycobacterium sp. WMMD1722]|uniref:hypothetical protein n=1 Tax=Mycobacterium sp. WMMD1722 TaxID=3404117 RepID=UPI003BF49867
MRKHTRTLIIGAGALIALGALPACGSETSPAPNASESPTAAATPFPESAKYIADVQKDGITMTIGIAVDGDSVTAYACDGSREEAWFFGDEQDGSLSLTGGFDDTLSGSYNGKTVDGDLTVDDVTYTFTAAAVPAPAGMYTATAGDTRASWIVRPDGSITGVQNGSARSDRESIGELNKRQDADAKQRLADLRKNRKLSSAPPLRFGTWTSTINGTPVTAKIVDGNTRFN